MSQKTRLKLARHYLEMEKKVAEGKLKPSVLKKHENYKKYVDELQKADDEKKPEKKGLFIKPGADK
jgi:hypothetical protein